MTISANIGFRARTMWVMSGSPSKRSSDLGRPIRELLPPVSTTAVASAIGKSLDRCIHVKTSALKSRLISFFQRGKLKKANKYFRVGFSPRKSSRVEGSQERFASVDELLCHEARSLDFSSFASSDGAPCSSQALNSPIE